MTRRYSNDWSETKRSSRNIPIGINNLVVCCGEKTEFNYFSSISEIIKSNYPKVTGIRFNLRVDAVDPLKMAKNVESYYLESVKRGQPYNHIWVVFDKDDFEKDNFDNAVEKINKLNFE